MFSQVEPPPSVPSLRLQNQLSNKCFKHDNLPLVSDTMVPTLCQNGRHTKRNEHESWAEKRPHPDKGENAGIQKVDSSMCACLRV